LFIGISYLLKVLSTGSFCGGQSVIRGIHENGCPYIWLCSEAPITIDFDDIDWPEKIILPWQPRPRHNVLISEVLGLKTIILGLAAVQAMASHRIVRFAVGFCGPSSA